MKWGEGIGGRERRRGNGRRGEKWRGRGGTGVGLRKGEDMGGWGYGVGEKRRGREWRRSLGEGEGDIKLLFPLLFSFGFLD